MSKVKIQGNASGTGVLTVEAPNTNTDRTITLPDSTGELIAKDGSGNLSLGDAVKATFGASDDLQIYHDGNDSYIADVGTGGLVLRAANNIKLTSDTGELYFQGIKDGASKVYYNGAEVLKTTSTGINVTGRITTDGITEDTSGNVGIGTSSPTDFSGKILQLHADSGSASRIKLTTATSGTATSNGGSITFDTSNDLSVLNRAEGNIILGTSNAERMRIDSSGNVLCNMTSKTDTISTQAGMYFAATGSTNDYASLYVGHHSAYKHGIVLKEFNTGGPQIRFLNSSGSVTGGITTTASSASYLTSSDYRLKENVVPMTGSIDRLKELKPSRFNFIADADKTVDGFLAHEAGEVVPECATGEKDAMRTEEYEVTPAVKETVTIPAVEAVEEVLDDEGNVTTEAIQAQDEYTEERVVTEAVMGEREVPDYQGIDQSKLVPLLVASLQEAVAKIEALETRVTQLENV